MIRLNSENCNKRKKELEHFKGFLPFQFDAYVDTEEREKFLKSIGLWDIVHQKDLEIMRGIRENRPNDIEYMEIILKKWVIDNPRYEDCVIME